MLLTIGLFSTVLAILSGLVKILVDGGVLLGLSTALFINPTSLLIVALFGVDFFCSLPLEFAAFGVPLDDNFVLLTLGCIVKPVTFEYFGVDELEPLLFGIGELVLMFRS